VAVITDEPSLFRLVHEGEFAGYVALRRMQYTYRRRRGLRRVQWSRNELESNFFLPGEGRPSGFAVVTEMADEVARDGIHYRGVAYTLAPLAEHERDDVWRAHLSDDPD